MGRIISISGVARSMRALLKAMGLASCTMVGLVALFEISQNAIGRSADAAANGAAPSPLFESRLDEMQAQFRGEQTVQPARLQSVGERQVFLFPSGLFSGCANSACANSACSNSACTNSACGGFTGCAGSACSSGSACAGSICVSSNCAGSVCAGSGCIPSVGCGFSGCAGSNCFGSGCAGSACKDCSGQAPGDGATVAGFYGDAAVVPASCPFGSTSDLNPVFVTGFNVERSMEGMRISWISTGAEVREFHVLRRGRDGSLVRVAGGPATASRLSHVAVPGAPVDVTVFLDIVDRTGWTTRVGSDGTTERIAAGGPAAGKVRADGSDRRSLL